MGPTGAVEGTVSITGPLPAPTRITLDSFTQQRRGCQEGARRYALPFGVSEPGLLPDALVTVDARSPVPPPVRRRYANFHDCWITPRFVAMSLNDRLMLHGETDEHHLPKVEGLGQTIAQLLQRTEDQEKHVLRPGNYLIHSINYPDWMQAPLVVTPNWFYDQADRQGRYRVENIPPGTYAMHAWFPGAQPVDATITIRANETARQDFTLSPAPPQPAAPPEPAVDSGIPAPP